MRAYSEHAVRELLDDLGLEHGPAAEEADAADPDAAAGERRDCAKRLLRLGETELVTGAASNVDIHDAWDAVAGDEGGGIVCPERVGWLALREDGRDGSPQWVPRQVKLTSTGVLQYRSEEEKPPAEDGSDDGVVEFALPTEVQLDAQWRVALTFEQAADHCFSLTKESANPWKELGKEYLVFQAAGEHELKLWLEELEITLLALRVGVQTPEERAADRAFRAAYKSIKDDLHRPYQRFATSLEGLAELCLTLVQETFSPRLSAYVAEQLDQRSANLNEFEKDSDSDNPESDSDDGNMSDDSDDVFERASSTQEDIVVMLCKEAWAEYETELAEIRERSAALATPSTSKRLVEGRIGLTNALTPPLAKITRDYLGGTVLPYIVPVLNEIVPVLKETFAAIGQHRHVFEFLLANALGRWQHEGTPWGVLGDVDDKIEHILSEIEEAVSSVESTISSHLHSEDGGGVAKLLGGELIPAASTAILSIVRCVDPASLAAGVASTLLEIDDLAGIIGGRGKLGAALLAASSTAFTQLKEAGAVLMSEWFEGLLIEATVAHMRQDLGDDIQAAIKSQLKKEGSQWLGDEHADWLEFCGIDHIAYDAIRAEARSLLRPAMDWFNVQLGADPHVFKEPESYLNSTDGRLEGGDELSVRSDVLRSRLVTELAGLSSLARLRQRSAVAGVPPEVAEHLSDYLTESALAAVISSSKRFFFELRMNIADDKLGDIADEALVADAVARGPAAWLNASENQWRAAADDDDETPGSYYAKSIAEMGAIEFDEDKLEDLSKRDIRLEMARLKERQKLFKRLEGSRAASKTMDRIADDILTQATSNADSRIAQAKAMLGGLRAQAENETLSVSLGLDGNLDEGRLDDLKRLAENMLVQTKAEADEKVKAAQDDAAAQLASMEADIASRIDKLLSGADGAAENARREAEEQVTRAHEENEARIMEMETEWQQQEQRYQEAIIRRVMNQWNNGLLSAAFATWKEVWDFKMRGERLLRRVLGSWKMKSLVHCFARWKEAVLTGYRSKSMALHAQIRILQMELGATKSALEIADTMRENAGSNIASEMKSVQEQIETAVAGIQKSADERVELAKQIAEQMAQEQINQVKEWAEDVRSKAHASVIVGGGAAGESDGPLVVGGGGVSEGQASHAVDFALGEGADDAIAIAQAQVEAARLEAQQKMDAYTQMMEAKGKTVQERSIQKVMNKWSNRSLSRVFEAWAGEVSEQLREKRLMTRVLLMMKNKVLSRAFTLWVQFHEAQRLGKLHETNVGLEAELAATKMALTMAEFERQKEIRDLTLQMARRGAVTAPLSSLLMQESATDPSQVSVFAMMVPTAPCVIACRVKWDRKNNTFDMLVDDAGLMAQHVRGYNPGQGNVQGSGIILTAKRNKSGGVITYHITRQRVNKEKETHLDGENYVGRVEVKDGGALTEMIDVGSYTNRKVETDLASAVLSREVGVIKKETKSGPRSVKVMLSVDQLVTTKSLGTESTNAQRLVAMARSRGLKSTANVVLEARKPTQLPGNGAFVLDFRDHLGRPLAVRANPRNIQLSLASDQSAMCLQFAKIDHGEFSLLYRSPVTAFQAFSSALAMFQ